ALAKPVDRSPAQRQMVHEGVELLAPPQYAQVVGLEDAPHGAAGFVQVVRMKEAKREGIAACWDRRQVHGSRPPGKGSRRRSGRRLNRADDCMDYLSLN